jgi:hypothetical protein
LFFVSCAACFFPQRGSSTARSRSIVTQASFLPSFVSFFLSFPLLLLFVLVWVILSQLKSFFLFLGGPGVDFLVFLAFLRASD